MKSNGRNIVILTQNSRLRQSAAAARRGPFLAAALCLGACQSSSLQDVTGSIGGASQPDIRRSAVELGRQYDRNPDDKAIALNYAAGPSRQHGKCAGRCNIVTTGDQISPRRGGPSTRNHWSAKRALRRF